MLQSLKNSCLRLCIYLITLASLMTSAPKNAMAAMPDWLNAQKAASIELLFRNISPRGARPGAVIAAPYSGEQNYVYHWVRDAALVMNAVIDLYEHSSDPILKNIYARQLNDFAEFSRINQSTSNRSAHNPPYSQNPPLGEPKFNIDGSPFMGDWGRPQNDGPALRAITLLRWRAHLASNKQLGATAKLAHDDIILNDLDFLVQYWTQKSFDLWEEAIGYHFYTRLAQRRALVEGAKFANALGDYSRQNAYQHTAQQLEQNLGFHWDEQRGFLKVTTNYDGSNRGKYSDQDSAIILAALHAKGADHYYAPSHPQMLATASVLESTFERIYSINARKINDAGLPIGLAMGRYPEDTYNGYNSDHTNGGNPWVLINNAFSEFYAQVALEFKNEGRIVVNVVNAKFFNALGFTTILSPQQSHLEITASDKRFTGILAALVAKSDSFFERLRFHAKRDSGQEHSFAEQINRESGYLQGAEDLTWNYASFITAISARAALSR